MESTRDQQRVVDYEVVTGGSHYVMPTSIAVRRVLTILDNETMLQFLNIIMRNPVRLHLSILSIKARVYS